MFKISKEFSFDMAHMLDGHDGKCKNLHGHTYKLQVELQGNLIADGAKRGMVIDYADLKKAVKNLIIEPLDHAFIYDKNSQKESEVASLLNKFANKTFALETRTTSEEIARFIFRHIKANTNLPICSVKLWETAGSFVIYSED